MNDFKYQCCFCGKEVEKTFYEPAQLIYLLPPDLDEPEEDQGTQYLFCHFSCLRKSFHPSVPILTPEMYDHEE